MTYLQGSERVVTKSEFAQMLNLSRGRISQLISEGRISGDALVGHDRKARIRVETALGQLERSRRGPQSFDVRQPQLGLAQTLPVRLGVRVISLQITYDAACAISSKLGGLIGARQAIGAGDLDACVVVIAHGGYPDALFYQSKTRMQRTISACPSRQNRKRRTTGPGARPGALRPRA